MSVFSKLPFADQLRTAVHFVKAFGVGAHQMSVLNRYISGSLFPEYDDEVHLNTTMGWLAQAQDRCDGDGVSCVYYLKSGWGIAYPETSGYILATFLVYADYSGDSDFINRAKQLGDWEVNIQAPNGGVYSSMILQQTRVFNTGQVVLGWCALYDRTQDEKYLQAAVRAGGYLLNEQEQDGTWRKDTFCGARTYHAGVAWALLRLAKLTGADQYANAAVKNLEWVLAQQCENGWFDQCGFNDDLPNMHVIVYTLRGLLESLLVEHSATDHLDILSAIIKGADALCLELKRQPVANIVGMVPTSFDRNWHSSDRDSCLTGNAQLSCFLYLLSHHTGNEDYRKVADLVLSAVKRTQVINTRILPIKGAVAGTFPLLHGYEANGYPNWAAKFFADALLMKLNFSNKLVIPA